MNERISNSATNLRHSLGWTSALVIVVTSLATSSWAQQGLGHPQTTLLAPKPDLTLSTVPGSPTYVLASVCRPAAPVLQFSILVKNVGLAASPGISDSPLFHPVQVVDSTLPAWVAGASLPALAPGAQAAVTLSLVAPADPAALAGVHHFTVTVNGGPVGTHRIVEQNYANNVLPNGALIVSIPQGYCRAQGVPPLRSPSGGYVGTTGANLSVRAATAVPPTPVRGRYVGATGANLGPLASVAVLASPTGLRTTDSLDECRNYAGGGLSGFACAAAMDGRYFIVIWDWPSGSRVDGFKVYERGRPLATGNLISGRPANVSYIWNLVSPPSPLTPLPDGTLIRAAMLDPAKVGASVCFSVTAYIGSTESDKGAPICLGPADVSTPVQLGKPSTPGSSSGGGTVGIQNSPGTPVLVSGQCQADPSGWGQAGQVIGAAWHNSGGGNSPLGCPVSGVKNTTSGPSNARYVQFQNGQIVYSPSTGPQSIQEIIGYPYPGRNFILFNWGPTTPFHYDKFLVRWWVDGQIQSAQQLPDLPGGASGSQEFRNVDLTHHTYSIIVEGCDNGGFLQPSSCDQSWSAPATVGGAGAPPPPPPPPACSTSITASFAKSPADTLNVSGKCFGSNNVVLMYGREQGYLTNSFARNAQNPVVTGQDGSFPTTPFYYKCFKSGDAVSVWAVGGNQTSNSVPLTCP